MNSLEERFALIQHLKSLDILTVFHYLSLHKSPFYLNKYNGEELQNSDRYQDTLLRLPLYYDLSTDEVDFICNSIEDFFKAKRAL
jgi:dTDP-4-amino-4,6-dideoxygalactose transaminase